MAEQGVCPSEEEMEAEQEIAWQRSRAAHKDTIIDAQAKQIAMRESVIGDLEAAIERVSQEKADLLAALRRAVNCIDPIRIKDADGRGPMTPIEEATVEQARAAIDKAEGK